MSSPYLLMIIFGVVVVVIIVFILVLRRTKTSESSLSLKPGGRYSSSPRVPNKSQSVVRKIPPQTAPSAQQSKSASKMVGSGDASPSPVDENYIVVQLRQNLKLKALGNERVVDSLIEFERKKDPSGNSVTWMRAAIKAWEDDNRRS